jgi:type II secretory pathway component PulF
MKKWQEVCVKTGPYKANRGEVKNRIENAETYPLLYSGFT